MKKKVTTAEKVMTSMMEAFLRSQKEAEAGFLCMKKEGERRKEHTNSEYFKCYLPLHPLAMLIHFSLHILQFFTIRVITSRLHNLTMTTTSN